MRRLRGSETLRDMLAEVHLSREQLIAPLFVREGTGIRDPIDAMPGQYRFSVDQAVETVRAWADLGIRAVLLFGVVESKDAAGSEAWSEAGPVQRLTAMIKRDVPGVLVITDVCLCQYTDHGHCGVIERRDGGRLEVDNDTTLPLLARVALSQAQAGADIVAPSAMMDGQIAAIREALDDQGLTGTAIMSYAVKFASAMYGPFREAAGSAPGEGDRRGYQMDYRAPRQALAEALLDQQEGADMLMVKPAATYMDVISRVRQHVALPVAAYHVSGEYAMIRSAAAAGLLHERQAVLEVTSAIRRAGADWIVTYFAEMLAGWL